MNTMMLHVIPKSANPLRCLRAGVGFLQVVALLLVLTGGAHAGLDKSLAKRPGLQADLTKALTRQTDARANLIKALQQTNGISPMDVARLGGKLATGQSIGMGDLPKGVDLMDAGTIKLALDRVNDENKAAVKAQKAFDKNERNITNDMKKGGTTAGMDNSSKGSGGDIKSPDAGTKGGDMSCPDMGGSGGKSGDPKLENDINNYKKDANQFKKDVSDYQTYRQKVKDAIAKYNANKDPEWRKRNLPKIQAAIDKLKGMKSGLMVRHNDMLGRKNGLVERKNAMSMKNPGGDSHGEMHSHNDSHSMSMKNGAKGNMNQNAKNMAQNTSKNMAQNTAKNSAKSNAQDTGKNSGKNAAKNTVKNSVKMR